MIIKTINGFICPFCNYKYKALAYHTRQRHKISSRELREMFNLPLNFSLQLDYIKENRRRKALENNMDKQLITAGEKTRFIKGRKLSEDLISKISLGHMKNNRKYINYKE